MVREVQQKVNKMLEMRLENDWSFSFSFTLFVIEREEPIVLRSLW